MITRAVVYQPPFGQSGSARRSRWHRGACPCYRCCLAVLAEYRFDPSRKHGLSGALEALQGQPLGSYMFGITAGRTSCLQRLHAPRGLLWMQRLSLSQICFAVAVDRYRSRTITPCPLLPVPDGLRGRNLAVSHERSLRLSMAVYLESGTS
jgi:hypothetical protein